jgi:hypothetical protein
LNLYKPERFQGAGKSKNYFEGWYFKSVDGEEKNAVSIIPGVSITGDPKTEHSFIQVLDGINNKAFYFRFSIEEFKPEKDAFNINIGGNNFSLNGLNLDLSGDGNIIKAELKFENIIPWPVSIMSPGVMGWYGFLPFMECYHGVLSFNHRLSGWIEINGKRTDFSGGKGFMEKDWGQSMPSSWIWIQTNHFDEPEASLFVSVAKIPWLGSFFTGFIAGMYLKGNLYRFATYTGAGIRKIHADSLGVNLVISDNKYVLEVNSKRDEGADLPAPKHGEMISRVNETLKAKINVRLLENGKEIFSGEGRNGGLEFNGNVEELRIEHSKIRKSKIQI